MLHQLNYRLTIHGGGEGAGRGGYGYHPRGWQGSGVDARPYRRSVPLWVLE